MKKIASVWEGMCGIVTMAVAFLTPFLSVWHRWGATDKELAQKLPGDELVPHPTGSYTHAITIKAPPAKVWPWLVQVGQEKGGFYSYEFLENLTGCKIKGAEEIIPEYQHLNPDGSLSMHPKTPALPLVSHKENGYILYCGELTDKSVNSWLFLLEPTDTGHTRFITRSRIINPPGRATMIMYTYLFGPISTVMQRKMLKGLRKRVEVNAEK